MLGNLLTALGIVITSPYNVSMILAGTVLGIVIGALPGLGATAGVGIILPFTFFMDPVPGFLIMISLYMAAEYGGSITAIALGIPGTPMAIATVWDGFKLTESGYPGKALGTSLVASTIGGMISTVILVLAAAPITKVALSFGPTEYFVLGLLGLSLCSNLAGKSVVKAVIGVMCGLLITTVGIDIFTGYPRFTFGMYDLYEQVPLVPMLVGIFGLGKVFQLIEENPPSLREITGKAAYGFPSLAELKRLPVTILRATGIGAIVGTIPGAGGTIASLIAYGEEKRSSKHPEKFGTGCLEGIAAPEAANNASVGGAMIPLITLGIPGSTTAAILLGGLMLQGLQPGPMLMEENPHFVYAIFVGFFIACIAMFALGYVGTRIWVAITGIPVSLLTPFILGICVIGAYALGNSVFNVVVAVIFGLIGYLMDKYGFPTAPFVLAIVLGYMVESNFRRALAISMGSYAIFFSRPVSLILFIISVLSFLLPVIRTRLKR